MRLYRQITGQTITVDESATLGKGGEAQVFGVVNEPTLAAKIYAEGKATEERAEKLALMLANPPDIPMGTDGHVPVAWPVDLLRDPKNAFGIVGFLMPRAYNVSEVINYYNPRSRLQKSPFFDYRYLMRTARNFAAGVRGLHSRGYVIGDVKHSNILVTPTALVTLVDTDSFQIRDPQSGRVFACPVQTPDFTPPELQGRAPGGELLRPEHDRFGLAVMIFHLLMEGTHPFSGVYLGQGDPPAFEERIAAGHFPFGREPGPYRPGVRVAPRFDMLAPEVRELFLQCFETGHADPSARPDALVWQKTLDRAMRSLIVCARNPHHHYGNHQADCPWCHRKTQLQGSDPFPASIVGAPQLDMTLPPPTKVGSYLANPDSSPLVPNKAPVPATSRSLRSVWVKILLFGAAVFGFIQHMSLPDNRVPVTAYQGPVNYGMPDPRDNPGYTGPASQWPQGTVPTPVMPVNAPPMNAATPIAISPDSTWVATSVGQPLLVRQLRTGVGWSHPLDRDVSAIAFSPDSKRVAVGTQGGVVTMMSITGKVLRGSFRRPYAVQSLAFSPSGDKLDVAFNDTASPLWSIDARTMTPPSHFRSAGPVGNLFFARYSPDNHLLAAVTPAVPGGQIKFLSNKGKNSLPNLHWPDPATCVAFAPDASAVAVGSREIVIWDIKRKETTRRVPVLGASEWVHSVAYSPDGGKIAYAGGTQGQDRAGIVNARTGSLQSVFNWPGFNASSVAFSPDGKSLVVADWAGAIMVYDVATGVRKGAFLNPPESTPHAPGYFE